MALPLKYNVRNVLVRWRSTLATVLGVALVVAVYIMVQALAVGLEKSSRNTGDPRNILIVRKGSTAESSSQVTREQYRLIPYLDPIARDTQGRPLVSADVIILVTLDRRDLQGEANVLFRGVSPQGLALRPQVRLAAGRWFRPGHREVVVSQRLARRFARLGLGDTVTTAGATLTVVGWLDGGGSAFDSEIWMDVDEARSIFERENYSSVLARARNAEAAQALIDRIESDKRLPLQAVFEIDYYAEQTKTALPIRILGSFLATAMSIGAVFAAMNTMYASVGARTREVGTLRVLGYRRKTILLSFLIEGALLSTLGGCLGVLLAMPIHGVSTGTMGFETFSETVFMFRITPGLAAQGLVFALLVGLAGSLLPAIRASRLEIMNALKSV